MQRIFIKKCFLFTVGRVSHKAVHNWVENFFQGLSKFVDDARPGRPGAEVAETTVKRVLSCEFRCKAMGQVYQCWWRICREINVFFSGSNITRFTFYIHLWHIYWLSLVLCFQCLYLALYFRTHILMTSLTSQTRWRALIPVPDGV
jgi:hypothetical protein